MGNVSEDGGGEPVPAVNRIVERKGQSSFSHVILDDTEVECKSLYGKPPEKDHKSFALVAYEGGRIAWEVRYPAPALGEITEAEPAG